jgi:hypothetical protein
MKTLQTQRRSVSVETGEVQFYVQIAASALYGFSGAGGYAR